MKNFFTITKSQLSKSEKWAAELLRELVFLNYRRTGRESVKTQIKILRNELNLYSISEKDLKNACVFHNVINEYVETMPKK